MVSNQKFESSRFKTKGDITGVVSLTAGRPLWPGVRKALRRIYYCGRWKKTGAGTKPLKSIDHVCASVGV